MSTLIQQLDNADSVRKKLSKITTQAHKSKFGQFMTPSNIAKFMASLFVNNDNSHCHLLDAGAGVGALSCAFLDRWNNNNFNFKTVEISAYEIDDKLHDYLARHLGEYPRAKSTIIGGDFIELNTQGTLFSECKYTHAILNPPYKKIKSTSLHRQALRTVGIETVNLYSAFVALAVNLTEIGGQIVAIIPRSFCNGPYYRSFRKFILAKASIEYIHLFETRDKTFKDDSVLQENVIIKLRRGCVQKSITISTFTDDNFENIKINQHPYNRIVFPNDPEKFIHIPIGAEKSTVELSKNINHTIQELGINISTGPVVDFRLKEHLHDMPQKGTVPLLYPIHFDINGTNWPKIGSKKPNAISCNNETLKWLYPNGFYCVVRRFSSKEEKRRIVASVVDPSSFGMATMLGFENHLNIFHCNKNALTRSFAYGLAVFLNSTAVDENFRRFNGHTQVNVTDLKFIKYPSKNELIKLGEWALAVPFLNQENIDTQFERISN